MAGHPVEGASQPADVAATLSQDPDDIAATLAELVESGLLLDGKTTLRITAEGRERLAFLLAEERSGVRQDVLAAEYAEFLSVNSCLKALVTDWQLEGGQPNTHDDPDYDGAVLARLDDVHLRVTPVIEAIGCQLPRLVSYADKLVAALARVKEDDVAWLTAE